MCFHTSQTKKVIELENRYNVKVSHESLVDYFDAPRYHLNGFSHPNMLVIPQERSDLIAPGVWGIVPNNKQPDDIKPYYKEAVKYGGGLNARSEKVFNHFIYRDSIMEKRCVIPVTGFFEPHDYKKKKYPYHIKSKTDDVLSLAGLYTVIGTNITFTILTKEASPLFERVHNLKKRQPIILQKELEQDWLNPELTNDDVKELLNNPFNDDELDSYTVSKDLFNIKVNSDVEDILNPVQYEELNTLF
ncbi:SOS response-associated peptidase [Flavobacteriaceae bacterium S0862]|nr:SOS response-associated peptidase [Flavobacteriaceae bacterium S0862]